MASGHANRANRPNTWLHRPATRREVLTCQPGAVHTWHLADIHTAPSMSALGGRADIPKSRSNVPNDPTLLPIAAISISPKSRLSFFPS